MNISKNKSNGFNQEENIKNLADVFEWILKGLALHLSDNVDSKDLAENGRISEDSHVYKIELLSKLSKDLGVTVDVMITFVDGKAFEEYEKDKIIQKRSGP